MYDLISAFSMLSTARPFFHAGRCLVRPFFFVVGSFVSVSIMKPLEGIPSASLTSHVPCAIVYKRLSVLCVGIVR